jgi:hypothetical protein
MFSKVFLIAILAILPASLIVADVAPTVPAPGYVANAGSNCAIGWAGDTSSSTTWQNMSIQLMTGDNYDMIALTSMYRRFSTFSSPHSRVSRGTEPGWNDIRILRLDLPSGEIFVLEIFSHLRAEPCLLGYTQLCNLLLPVHFASCCQQAVDSAVYYCF